MAVSVINNTNVMNLTRSLEKILDECCVSGELVLANRKLKDFPKYYGKYNLTDTVFADLSRNRFCELPEDVTSFVFLERLLLYHNAIRSIPESVRSMHSLTYLDLRSNQLTVLPREICYLPLQIFLISNNRLTTLPDELGRMSELTELDAGCNQLTHLPARLTELTSLRSLNLRSNQLMYLPRDLTNLNLFSLDISCNKIASLPVELRLMTSLVDLNLADNPLTSPPTSVCVRGMIHVFKYLETIAAKEGKVEGTNSLRRSLPKQHSTPILNENLKLKRNTVDSGYSTSDGGLDSKWAQEPIPKWHLPATPLHVRTELSKSDTSTPAGFSPSGLYEHTFDDDLLKKQLEKQRNLTHSNPILTNGFVNASNDISPEANTPDSQKSDDKLKAYGNVQTYREYKEALRQQRSQDIYKTKEVSTPDGTTEAPIFKTQTSSTTSSPYNGSSQNSPMPPYHNGMNGNGFSGTQISQEENKGRPVQKVTPSRSVNGSHANGKDLTDGYMKPNSPIKKTSGILQHNNLANNSTTNGSVKGALVNGQKPLSGTTVGYVNNNKSGQKTNKSVSWNRDLSTDKLSFTMRREIDKHKEEEELNKQLRSILETKLKMSLPDDLSSALSDGVILCHLANHVRPRSVVSIHVPSPAVPKLTMARCRRNVDNFLEACRKIGVDEEFICSCGDVVPLTDDAEHFRPPNEAALFRTLGALLLCHNQKLNSAKMDENLATNTTTVNDDGDDGFVDDNVPLRGIRRTPETLDFNRKRKYVSVKFQLPDEKQKLGSSDDSTLTEIIEECEYDSDIGKFKCKDDDVIENEDDSEGNSSTSSMVDHYLEVVHLNNLNSPPKCETNSNKSDLDINNIVDDDSHYKIVMKRIEFFESHGEKEKFVKCEKLTNLQIPSREEQILSTILLVIFSLTVTLLIIFPLPNY